MAIAWRKARERYWLADLETYEATAVICAGESLPLERRHAAAAEDDLSETPGMPRVVVRETRYFLFVIRSVT